ncbi:MAG: hypothetical protein WBG48_13695 [Pricia sp.]
MSIIYFVYLIIGTVASPSLFANCGDHQIGDMFGGTTPDNPQITLNSNSFTAQKRSSFSFGEVTEQIERGLTVIHFKTSTTFEYRTYDTHSSEEAAVELRDVLERLLRDNVVFAILAHDSAAKSLAGQTANLSKLGFSKLASLKSRQAYIMHNLNGSIYEVFDDVSVSETLTVPSNTADANIYFPKIKYEFEPNNNRYIAHAGGEVNGIKSTNTKDALDQNYAKGFRFFELDIIETSDKKLVAAHDWKMWARFTDYTGALPPSLEEFKKHKIYGDYTTMDFDDINAWFAAHPDATLVTDKVNDPTAFANAFVDKNRLIMELFSLMAVEKASQNGIHTMISQEPLMAIKGDKLNYLAVNNIKYAAVSRRIIASQSKLLLKLRDEGIKVYVYNVNFDAGKDEKYVQENELGLVYGMYADKWMFDMVQDKTSK